jgi:MFS family permease
MRADDRLPDGKAALKVIVLLFLVTGVYQLGTGILTGFVPIKLAINGFPASVVGWVSMGFSIGFLIGCLTATIPINALGTRNAIVAFAGLNVCAALVLWLTPSPHAWGLSRAAAGFASACLFVLVETWLASRTTSNNRALVFGLYMVLSRLAFTFGQIALAVVDPSLATLFLVAAAFYAVSPWAAFAIPGDPPAIGAKSRPSLVDLPVKVPAVAPAALVHGLIGTAGPSLFPVYALGLGLTVDQTAILLAAIPFGGLVLQLPFSLLSDRLGRRTVLGIVALATTLISAAFLLLPTTNLIALSLMAAIWGGAPALFYPLAVAHANDIATDEQRIGWSSTLLLLWGIGAATGPIAASLLMERYGNGALFSFTGVFSLALVVFLGMRKLLRKRGPRPTSAVDTIGPSPGPGG